MKTIDTIVRLNFRGLLALLLAVVVSFFGGFASQGATRITTAAGGNWDNTSTWAGGVVPINSDAAIVLAGASVTVTSTATVNSLIFSNNSASTATLTINSGVTLTVTAGMTNQNSATTNTSALIQGAGTLTCTSLSVGGTTTPTPPNSDFTATLTSTISSLSVSGNLTIKALYNSTPAAANQGTFALSSGAVAVGGSVAFVTVPIFGPILSLASGSQSGTLTLSGATPFTFSGGGSSTFTPNGTNATVNYSGAAQTVQGATYQNLVLSGSGSKTTTGVTVNGTLSMQGTATASVAPGYGASSTLEYHGNAAQTTGPELAGLANLTINNTNGVTAASTATVTNTLTFIGGKLITGANQLNLATNGSVSGASTVAYVNGNLQKAFRTGTQTFTFPVGDGSVYAPLTLSNLSVSAIGSVKASTTGGSHPQFGSSGLDSSRNVNRYWTLTQSGGTLGTYNATFNYPVTDVDTNAMPAQFVAAWWNGSAWSPGTVSGTPTTTFATISNQSGFGDFAIGNASPWYNGAWRYRLTITINHTNVAGSLTNFPVLINLTNSALQLFAKTNGNDILFTSSDGTTKLAHEIERYTSTNGALIAWANVPLLSPTTDTLLYLYYGNAAATNQQNAPAVWSPNYVGVWHLSQTPTGSAGDMADSSSVTNSGTSQTISSGAQVAGKINGSLTLDGVSDYISTSVSFNNPVTLTVQAWVKTTSTNGTKVVGFENVQTGTGAGNYDRHIYIGTDGKARFGTYNNSTGSGNVATSTGAINDGQWHFLVGCRDNVASNVYLYVDGVLQSTTASSAGQAYTGWYRIGSYKLPSTSWPAGSSGYFAGSVDEVRVAHAARNTAWVNTEFNNQRAPGTFSSIGGTQMVSAVKLAVTSVNGGSSPSVSAAFSVVVQSQDNTGTPQNVVSNTAISLSLNTGAGSLGGTLTGTILAGTNSATITNVTYTTAESGVSLTATRTGGDNLASGNSATFTVLKGNQSITFPSPGNQTYGVGPLTLGATASSGLTVGYSVLSGPATVSNNVLTITGAASVTIQASQPGNSNWNAAATTNQTISIAQKTITGSITASNKVYDATPAATIATRTLSGVTNSDVVSLTGGTATFTNKNVGNGKTVTATGLSLTGPNATNYVLASTSATNTANITKATLTVSATGVNRVYNGTNNATVSLSDNRLGGDVLTANYTTANFIDKNVGNGKTVNVSGIAISGTDSGNYNANTTASTTANITQATLTVSATGVNKVYDGTTNATVTLSDNRLAGDVLTANYTTANFTDKNVGNGKTVNVSGIAISGTDSGNYNANTTASTTANITQATLTVSATGVNKVYDGTTNATVTLSDNRLAGDVLTANYTTANFTDKNVGNGKTVNVSGIAISGTDSGNYNANTAASTTANITPTALTVSATGVNKIYDGTISAMVTLSDNRPAGDVLSPGYAAANFADPNVGNAKTVNVTGISLTGTDSGNYTFNTSAVATANITAALLTVTANNTNRPYGKPNPSFTGSYSGFVNGEGTNILSGSPMLSTLATTNSPVGPYPIQIDQGTLSSTNYIFAFNNGTLTVIEVPAVLAISYVAGPTNHVDLQAIGLTPDNTYHVQASPDLRQWNEIGTAQAASDGTFLFTDTDLAAPVRFYRLSNN